MAEGINRNPTEAELRELLATSCRILYKLGLSDYLGHPSARVQGTDRIIIKPKHSPRVRGMDTMTAEMMVVIDLDGKLLEGDEIPPAERFIHTEIYRARPDVLSVVHTHQPISTLCGSTGLPILPILHVEAPHLEAEIPVFPCAELIVNQALGRGVAEALGQSAYCHLQGHGIVAVDVTVEEATLKAVHMERAAEANFRAAQIGRQPWVIPPDQIANLRKFLADPSGRWAYYKEIAG
jgi:L-ribulose-5-phosphate 4-epimerase